jgi:hypothetical protein
MSATRSKSDLKLSIEASKHAQTITGGIERVCEKLGVAEGEALDLGGRHGQRRPEHRDGRRDGQAPVAAPRRRRPTPRGSSPATRRCAASRTRRTHEIPPPCARCAARRSTGSPRTTPRRSARTGTSRMPSSSPLRTSSSATQ